MAFTITLVEAQPHRQRYKLVNVAGAGTDLITQATIAGNGVAGQPLRDIMAAVYANLAAWTEAAFESSIMIRITSADGGPSTWSAFPQFAGTGNITMAASGNGTAYIDIEFDYAAGHWPPY